MERKAVLTGGTGFVGSYLSKYLAGNDWNVHILTRNPDKYTDEGNISYHNYEEMDSLVDGSDAVINLAGENLFDNRWTDELKSRILNSRVETTRTVVQAIDKAQKKPEVLVSASAVGFYGSRGEEELRENTPAGDDFLSNICTQWEAEAQKVTETGTRLVIPRIGIVIQKDGGALSKMLTPFWLFVGGPLGSGKQYFPWIHMDDICEGIHFLITNKETAGIYNFAAPEPKTMSEFAKELGGVINRPSFFKVPQFVLNIVLGEAAEAVTASLKVIPERLAADGYEFNHPELEGALKEILKD